MPRSSDVVARLSVLAVLFAGPGGLIERPVGASERSLQPAVDEQSDESLLDDFIHYVRIARFDIAAALADELLARDPDPVVFVDLVDRSRLLDEFQEALALAQRVPAVEDQAAALDRLYSAGKLARARDRAEIAKNIDLLTGTLRQRMVARERLLAAGEYAMPQLTQAYLQNSDGALKAAAQQVIIDLGRQAIAPLAAVVSAPELDPARKEQVVEVLRLIPYRTSLPYLVDLHQTTGVDALRQATARAIVNLGGDVNASPAVLFAMLADAYYEERPELTSFPEEGHQLLWSFDGGAGLVPTAIRTAVYHEAMAMRTAETSLSEDPSDRETLALWIAANYSREIDTPAEYENPVYPASRRAAEYFAVASGPEIGQRVLRRAVDDLDTPLARRAIASIEATAGPTALWERALEGRQPLLESLSYPNRRVQYEAALALGKSQPQSTFSGSERVVPTLASAVRDAAARYAIVLTGADREEYARFRTVLEDAGYAVLPPGERGLGDIAAAIASTPGVDLVVTSLGADTTEGTIDEIRADARLAAVPVLAMVRPEDVLTLQRRFGRERLVAIRRSSISDAQFGNAASDLLEVASGGPISSEEAALYADRSLTVLRDLAVGGNTVLDVSAAAPALIDVLAGDTGDDLLDIAEVLAFVDQDRAQRALFDEALERGGVSRLALLEKVSDSGKRFGNMLDARQLRRLLELAGDADYELATSAVAVMGSLGLPNERLVPLILEQRGEVSAAVAGGG